MGCCGDKKNKTLVAKTKHVVAGAVKRCKSVAGIGIASNDIIESRRAMCRTCPHADPCAPPWASKKCVCGKCGCPLKHKTRLADETCPAEKWVA